MSAREGKRDFLRSLKSVTVKHKHNRPAGQSFSDEAYHKHAKSECHHGKIQRNK